MGNQYQPLITIVTPSYNQDRFIEETILSVLNQTYKNIQYIIVDGGSSDKTMSIVEKYNNFIDIIIHEKDKGQADAINKGFRLAKGELVGWINSDDILYPECVEKIVELYKSKPNGSIYYHSLLDWINEKSVFFLERTVKICNRNYLLNNSSTIIQQGSFYSRELVEKVEYTDINNHYCMDLDLWLKISKYAPIYYTENKSYSGFRIYEGTKTTTGKTKFLKNIKQVLLQNGANRLSKNIIIGYYWFYFKITIKDFLYGFINRKH